jgi:hypothetical protein
MVNTSWYRSFAVKQMTRATGFEVEGVVNYKISGKCIQNSTKVMKYH